MEQITIAHPLARALARSLSQLPLPPPPLLAKKTEAMTQIITSLFSRLQWEPLPPLRRTASTPQGFSERGRKEGSIHQQGL